MQKGKVLNERKQCVTSGHYAQTPLKLNIENKESLAFKEVKTEKP